MRYEAVKWTDPDATGQRQCYGKYLRTDAELDEALAAGYTIRAIDPSGAKTLVADPEQGFVVDRPHFGPSENINPLKEALEIILNGTGGD